MSEQLVWSPAATASSSYTNLNPTSLHCSLVNLRVSHMLPVFYWETHILLLPSNLGDLLCIFTFIKLHYLIINPLFSFNLVEIKLNLKCFCTLHVTLSTNKFQPTHQVGIISCVHMNPKILRYGQFAINPHGVILE